MTIESELIDLATNLQNAKDAVTAKGGTVGDTGLAGLAAEIQTIPNGGGQAEPSNGGHITGYDTTTGVITGDGFGSTQGTVYLLDRDTNSYVSQPVSSWSSSSITLTTPIDTTSIEGDTSLSVVDSNGEWATKWLVKGSPITGYGLVYVQDSITGVVRKIYFTSADDVNVLIGGSNRYSSAKTIGSDTFYLDEIVGFQYGTSFTNSSLGNYFLSAFVNLNQPVVLPSTVTSLGNYAFNETYNFNQPLDISHVTSFGSGFSDMYHFNQPIIFSTTATNIPTSLLTNAYSFDQPLEFPSVTTISAGLLSNARSFNQNITIPDTVTSIGNNFLSGATNFNSDIVLSSHLTTIGNSFLSGAASFNKRLAFPTNLASIGDEFMSSCSSFDQELSFPSTLTTIGSNFLASDFAFNSELTFGNITSIGGHFLSRARSFDKDFTLPTTLTSIGSDFMNECSTFSKHLTIPSGVTSIGDYMLRQAYSFTSLTVNTSSTPPANGYSLSVSGTAGNYCKSKLEGITVTGSGVSNWLTALPNTDTSNLRRNLINGMA